MAALIITFVVLLLINAPIAFVIGGAGMAWFISAGRNLDILAQYVEPRPSPFPSWLFRSSSLPAT